MSAGANRWESRVAAYDCDVAISAVAFDAMLVAELTNALSPRVSIAAALPGSSPRLLLVLHQRLWGHDDATRFAETAVQARLQRDSDSVLVVTLDDASLPCWSASLPKRDLATLGVSGVSELVLEAVVGAGGSLRSKAPRISAEEPPRWADQAPPFLTQARAQSTLRREFDALSTELRGHLLLGGQAGGEQAALHILPHRLIARIDSVAVSFSWVGASGGAVADGRLMVIEWRDVVATGRGVPVLKGATPVRECVYRADATNPDDFCWRAEDPNGRAHSTAHLAGQWLTVAQMPAAAGAG